VTVGPWSAKTRYSFRPPWIPTAQSAATTCKTETGYELKEGEIKPTWQMYRVLMGQENKRHFGLVRLDPERPSPTILGDTGCTTAGLVHPYEIRKLPIAEIKALCLLPRGIPAGGELPCQMGSPREQRPAALDESHCRLHPPPLLHEQIFRAIIRYSRSRAARTC
jgi:hypothetical protein